MSAGNVAVGVVIGGAVSATFGKALSDSSSKIDGFKKKAEQARGFHNLIGDTIRLRSEMGKMSDKSGDAFGKLLKAHEKNIAKLKEHGFAVDKLDKDYARLGRTVKGLELSAQGRARIGEGIEQTKEGLKAGAAITAAVAVPVIKSADYQAIIRDIAIKDGIARTDKEKEMSDSIRKDAKDSGMNRNELAEAVNTLVAGGMKAQEATSMASLIGKFSVGQNADSTDVSKMVLALRQAGINDPKVMQETLGKIAVAGDLGSFESKDMAKHFSSLMPQLTAFGMSGEKAALSLANMLQTQMKAAGSADEAAINLANLLSKLTSEDSKSKFADKGINLEGSMQAHIAAGIDPIESFLSIVEKSVKKVDPKKAKEMAALQERIAKASNPEEAQKMLDGYIEMAGLSEFISDRQAKQAALAALQNRKLTAENKKTIETTDGLAKIEKDLADRRATSKAKWTEVGQAIDEAMTRIGDAIRPLTDTAATGIAKFADAVAWLAQELPKVTMAVVGVGAALATYKVGKGVWNIGRGVLGMARGGWMARGGGGLLGRVLGGRAGGAAAAALGSVGAQPVFVTNWPMGGAMDFLGGGRGGRGGMGRAGSMLGRLGKYGGRIGGALAVAGAAYQVYDTATNATTANEKAEGYGSAAGSLAGGLAGAKVGAMVGAFAGPIGMAIGGVLGGVVGGIGGSEIGGAISKKLFGSDDPEPGPQEQQQDLANQAQPELLQQDAFSPNISIVVQGDVKEPAQIANELMPHLRRLFDDYVAQKNRAGLYDAVHL